MKLLLRGGGPLGRREKQCFAPRERVACVWERIMPEISRFLGIIVRMFAEPEAKHHVPHFHVYYQDSVAVYGISPVDLLAGELPPRQRRLVEGWAELHQSELMDDWRRLEQRKKPLPIAPLQ